MKLLDTIASTLCPGSYIIQFSPIRTGSTLIFNVLVDLFPKKRIKKTHTYDAAYARLKTVCTIRHPLDSIASTIKTKRELKLTPEQVFRQSVAEFEDSGIRDIIRMVGQPNTLIFKYEEFIEDLEPVFDRIEAAFGRKIPEQERARIKEKQSIDAVASRSSALGEFSNWDPVTKLHGNHISDTKGRPNVYKTFFTEEQIAELEERYGDFLDKFGYR
jgi:hypothetical protein